MFGLSFGIGGSSPTQYQIVVDQIYVCLYDGFIQNGVISYANRIQRAARSRGKDETSGEVVEVRYPPYAATISNCHVRHKHMLSSAVRGIAEQMPNAGENRKFAIAPRTPFGSW
jgi:hypothetical protein